jgi:hypothetical protein
MAISVNSVIEVPIGEIDESAYVSSYVQAQLNKTQSASLKRIWAGLDEVGERLANGRRVVSHADVIRWLLERAARHEAI